MRSVIIICGVACFLLASCKKFLDVKPKGKTIPVTVADFDHLLDNSTTVDWTFKDNNAGSLLSYLTDNVSLTPGVANVAYVLNNHPSRDHYYAYIFRQPYKNPLGTDYFWNSGSGGIYFSTAYFNNVIEGIRNIQGKDADQVSYGNRVTAQALTARAWAYFNLSNIYGPVYKPGGNNTTKTIPYVTSPDLGVPIPDLSTQEEVYANVLRDLHAALLTAPDVTNWPSRANKNATYALLAYYHLFTKKFDSVAYYANLAWTSATAGGVNKVLYDYNGFAWATPSNPVNSTITAQDAFLNAVNSREMLFYRATDAVTGYINAVSPSYPSAEYMGLFDQANDLRFKYFFLTAAGYKTTAGGGYDDGQQIQYYRGSKTVMTEGITYPELLLMRAEGYARTNKLTEAIADLNTLRQFRYKTGTPALAAGTQDQVIQMVLDERRRELPLGGVKRLLDLKRLTLDVGKPWSKTQIVHTIGTQSYTGTIDGPDFILTISNQALEKNPNWGIPLDTRPF